MPIDYTSTTASLPVRLGKIISLGKDLRSQQGSTLTNIEEVNAQYTATSVDRVEYLATLASTDKEMLVDEMGRPLQSAVKEALEQTIFESVNAGLRPVPDVDTAIRALAVDMIEQTQSIGTTSVSIGSISSTATGNGTLILSSAGKYVYGGAKYTSKQTQNDCILRDTINARCIKDARDGSLVRGNEQWFVEGKAPTDRLNRRWQDSAGTYGSGASLTIHSTCGSIENSSQRGQNMLTNGGFERVDGTPVPLDWVIQTGVAGTNIISPGTGARGSDSVRFTGNNVDAYNIYEVMGIGPRPAIKSNTVYVVSALLKAKGANVTTGTIALQLRDGSNVEISGCSVSRNMAVDNVTTASWVRLSGSFTTPLNLPSEVRFCVAFTVKLGLETLDVDEVVLTEAEYLYPGGLAGAIVAGTADWELDDRMQSVITKTTGEWQSELDRYLNLAQRGVQFPVSASPTFSTTLLT